MNTYRKTAVMVGILFIIGTDTGVLAGAFTAPIQVHYSCRLRTHPSGPSI